MSFVIQGPYPAMRTTLLLPSPQEGNTKSNAATVQTLRAMDGTLYTYIKSKRARQKYNWTFTTSKDKALEAKEFISIHADGLVKITDHNDTTMIGYITINPLDQAGLGRAVGWGKNEEVSQYTIEFEENV